MGHILGIIIGAAVGWLLIFIFTDNVAPTGYGLVMFVTAFIGFLFYDRMFNKQEPKEEIHPADRIIQK